MAVLQNKDLQAMLSLTEAFASTKQFEFWGFLQSKLLSDAHSERKMALYILKSTIERIAAENTLDECLGVVHNQVKSASDFTKMWNAFFNLMEALEDNPLHLITPSLVFLEGIAGIHPMWLTCVYKSTLTHSLNSVAFHGLICLLHDGCSLEVSFFKTVVKYVLIALNKIENSEEYHKSLSALEHFIKLCTNEIFVILVEESLCTPWVPPATWYFYKTIFNCSTQPMPASIFTDVIRKLKNLPHKFIREGCLRLAVSFLEFNEDISFEEFLKSAACLVEYNQIFFPDKVLPTWKKDIVCNEIEKWQREKVFVSASKIYVLMRLIQGNEAILSKLFSLAKDREVPSQTRDCIALYLSKSYLSKSDVFNYICERMNDVKADDDFDILTDIIINNVTPTELEGKLEEKTVHITSNPRNFEPHELHLAIVIACCLGLHVDVTQILGTILKDTKTELQACFCDFFISKYCASDPPEDEPLEVFEGLLNTQGEDVLAIVLKHLPHIMGCLNATDISKFLEFCRCKLTSLSNSSAFRFGLRQYLTCRFDPSEASNFLKEYEPSAYVLADILKVKHKEGSDLESYIPLIVELLLYGGVYGKQRRIEFDVCLEIQRLSKKHVSENPALEETRIRSKAIAALLNVFKSAPNVACRCRMGDTIASIFLKKYRAHFNKRYFADSQIHLLKLRIIQGLLLIHTYISTEQAAVIIDFVMNSFCDESHQPSIKHLLQWLMIRMFPSHQESDLFEEMANKIRCADHTRPSSIVAFIPVLLHVCRGKPEETIEKLFSVLLPWTMGPQFKLRLYSQIAIKKLGDFCCAEPYQSVFHKYKAVIDSVRLTLRETNIKQTRNILQSDEYFLDLFDPEKHYSLETIYIEIPRLDGVTSTEWELLNPEDFPESDDLKACNDDEKLRNCVFHRRDACSGQVDGVKAEACTNLQKKIIPSMHETRELKSDLILVCSLIESPANLGGLARTCEVYGVKRMVIHDSKTVNCKDFKSLSMSSENWVDIVEVKAEELRDYLMRAKQRGYVVIGAEQTSESVRLDRFQFPLRSVLVLGNEREGILPSIIPLLDVCLEIPQFGLVRSLNVHVAGATFIWEYVKQHLVK